MEIFIISIAAFFTAILTFFSGFGLGTILTPVFMIFFPVELAIGLTGIVHFLNNIFKLLLVGKNTNRDVLMRFGLPAIVFALIGSWLLLNLKDLQPLFAYALFDKKIEVFPIKFIISIILITFASLELIPNFSKLEFDKNKLPLGGALSGFFGGLSGNQGALRSAFLIKAGLSKEEFVATTVVISVFVDFTRLSVYATNVTLSDIEKSLPIIICAVISAILGAFIGNKLLKKVTIKLIQKVVAILLILLSILLGMGLI